MTGLKPAVVGLIGNAVLNVVFEVFTFDFAAFKTPGTYVSLVLFGSMTVLAFKKVHPIIIICISAVVGIIFGYVGWL
jgi:chromate transporter